MMNFIYALDAVTENYPEEIVGNGGETLILIVCIVAGALLLTAGICIGVAIHSIRKARKDKEQ